MSGTSPSTRLTAIAIEWTAFTLAGVIGFFAFVFGTAAGMAMSGPEFFKMNVPPVNVLGGALVGGALAIALVRWADRHRRARIARDEMGTPPPQPAPKHVPITAAATPAARPSTSLDVIKAQILQLLRQPHVVQSAMRFQRSDLVMALAQQGFRGDYPDLEGLVDSAVGALLVEGRLEEQGNGVRAKPPL